MALKPEPMRDDQPKAQYGTSRWSNKSPHCYIEGQERDQAARHRTWRKRGPDRAASDVWTPASSRTLP